MTQQQILTAVFTQIGLDVKDLLAKQGNLAALSTTAKTSLVAAINEIAAKAVSNAATINDSVSTGTTVTYSVDKIISLITGFKNDILGGVPAEAFNTLKEIADYIGSDQTATSGLVSAVALRVSVEAQSFTNVQKIQARTNIGAYGFEEIGDPAFDLLSIYTASKS